MDDDQDQPLSKEKQESIRSDLNQSPAKTPSRPQSYYDNFSDHTTNNNKKVRPKSDGNTYSTGKLTKIESPTQVQLLATTVPQNIAAQNIGGKHTPTRNSLRHSRMIVMNRNGRVPQKYLPTIIRYHKLAKSLMGLVTLCGTAICFLAVWLLVWAPNLRSRDNPYWSGVPPGQYQSFLYIGLQAPRDFPYWSGIPVTVSGILGLILLCCCRKQYPGRKRCYIVEAIKVLSIFTSIVGAMTALTAAAFAIIHLATLTSMTCLPNDMMNHTCLCTAVRKNNDTLPLRSYHYIDLSCPEVDNVLTILLMFNSATNILAGILELWYIYLHWASRVAYTYTAVRTEDEPMTPMTPITPLKDRS